MRGLSLLLVGEFLPPRGGELADAVAPLLDECGDHLERFAIVEVADQLDALVRQRRLEHPQRVQRLLIARAQGRGDVGVQARGQGGVGHPVSLPLAFAGR